MATCSSVERAEEMAAALRRNRKIGSLIEIVVIELTELHHVRPVRELLQYSNRMSTLQLVLPSASLSCLRSLLPSAPFFNLTVLKTNLPHEVVARLAVTTRLESLSVERCRSSGSCPLGLIALPNLRHVKCEDAGCLLALSSTSLASVECRSSHGWSESERSPLLTACALRIPLSNTGGLAVQDLKRIAPDVQLLTLVEGAGVNVSRFL